MAAISKILTKTDVEKRFAITSKSLTSFFPPFQNGRYAQIVRMEGGDCRRIWRFRLRIRKKGKYKKPVLAGGEWLEFVKYMKLQVGDQVRFLKEGNEDIGVHYKIRVYKPVLLFKAVIGYAPNLRRSM